ncbi:MAG: PaaI family thioesterase [Actinomycetota bacterium]
MDVDRLNDFFGSLAPGLHGVVFDQSSPDRVAGHIDVTDTLIAGTGFLFAPAVISLADTLCAAGCGNNLNEDQSFTTVELKSNFLSSARVGERVVGVATPAHLGRQTHVWDVTITNATSDRTMALFRCTQMILTTR